MESRKYAITVDRENDRIASRNGEIFQVGDRTFITKCMTVGTDGNHYRWAELAHSLDDNIFVFREDEILKRPC